ncbi:8648_t:CDS:2 [Paraglomus occultum]|uniref:DASH complex subunit ASK1 n=1 Tax=Paraglomus occultum TaxID=144539 RepID=A0A9N8W9M4_9GLOM|nr:8648_t:CDS:2 [Paraglomus occultum]
MTLASVNDLTARLEKIEQNITLTLQEIDHNFSTSHHIVATRVLPQVERFAQLSKDIWDNTKFWLSFFESLDSYSASNDLSPATNNFSLATNSLSRAMNSLSPAMNSLLPAMNSLSPAMNGLSPAMNNLSPAINNLPNFPTMSQLSTTTKQLSSTNSDLGFSPPVTMKFSLPPSKLLRTPAPEAARIIMDDVMQMISPVSTPCPMSDARQTASSMSTPCPMSEFVRNNEQKLKERSRIEYWNPRSHLSPLQLAVLEYVFCYRDTVGGRRTGLGQRFG